VRRLEAARKVPAVRPLAAEVVARPDGMEAACGCRSRRLGNSRGSGLPGGSGRRCPAQRAWRPRLAARVVVARAVEEEKGLQAQAWWWCLGRRG